MTASPRNFARYAAEDPDRPAVVDADGGFTYAELLSAANRLSNGIVAAGVRRGETVAVLLPNGRHIVLAERAVTQLPLYFTPVNWHLTAGEVAYILVDSGAVLLLTVRGFLDTALAAADEAGLARDRVVVLDDPGFTAGQDDGPPPGRSAGQRMLYTSGTTGRPKGVRRALPDRTPEENAALAVNRAALYRSDHEDGRYLSVAPMYHAAPLAYAVQGLDVGHTIRVLPRWDPEAALAAIDEHAITWMYVVPMMLSQWLALDREVRDRYDVSSLRSLLHTAAPCPIPVKRAAIEWFGPVLNEIYGGTEASATFIDSTDWLAHPGSVGKARATVSLRIVGEDGRDLPPGEIGKVYFANSAMPFEYHRDPQKTADSTVDGHVNLGDIGYLDAEGYLYLCDRGADTIISGGVNIYPAEIEQALAGHPDVLDSCVIGAPDPQWGERVHALVVLRGGVPAGEETAEALRAYLRGEIAGFKVPRTVEFRAGLPRSDAGKLLRRVVREEFWGDRRERI